MSGIDDVAGSRFVDDEENKIEPTIACIHNMNRCNDFSMEIIIETILIPRRVTPAHTFSPRPRVGFLA